MDPIARELLRHTLLEQGAAAGERGLPFATLLTGCRLVGSRATPEQIMEEIIYLEDKGLLTGVAALISPENRRWRTTAAGRDYLAQIGLA
jgi:hypothetical protein